MTDRRPRPWDVGFAAAGAIALIAEGQMRSRGGMSPGAYALAIVAATPLAWRSRAPLSALAAVELGAVLCAAAFGASWAATAIVLFQLYTVALLGDRQTSVLIAAITAVGVVVAVVLIDGRIELTGAALRVAFVLAAVASGDTVRSRRALGAAAREHARREEQEREEQARRRVSAERLRIAQELHDELAHSLVAINVRSGVALDLNESEDAVAALHDIKQVSASALHDLRATLSLLRDRGDAAPTTPPLDLDAIPGLLDHVRSAGLQTDLDVQLDGATIPSAISGAAYRIVQEAVTNVMRHADATSAHVSVRAAGGSLAIDVTDDGRSNRAGAQPGLGLRGMAERSTAVGGHIDAGPVDGRGWRVHAVLPLGDQRR